MIKNIKNQVQNIVKKTTDKAGLNKLQIMLFDQIGNTINKVLSNRKADTENSNYSPEDLKKITDKYMRLNIAIATASSFIPGPAGIITAVPSMISSMSNQLKASYDIACAHDKESGIGTDVLLNVMLQSRGIPTGITDLSQMNKITDTSAIKNQIMGLSEVIARKKIKSTLTGMIPGLSTVFAVVDAKKETMKVVTTSTSFYDPSEMLETITTTAAANAANPAIINSTNTITTIIDISEEELFEEKLKLLINLLTVDGKAAPEEISFIGPLIQNSTLALDKKDAYIDALWKPFSDYNINFELIKQSGDADEAMVDLAVLTKRDKVVATEELEYVKHAAEHLEIEEAVYQKLLDETYLEGVQ